MSKLYDTLVQHIVENQNQFYRAAYYYVKNREAALDVVQNAICKALENYDKLQSEEALGSWFYRILINESLMYLRKEHKYIAWDETDNDLLEGSYEEKAYEPKIEVADKVADLPTDMQIIIQLHFYEEKTLKEIAEITETNLNTVKSRLYAACKKLGKELEDEDATIVTRHRKSKEKSIVQKEKEAGQKKKGENVKNAQTFFAFPTSSIKKDIEKKAIKGKRVTNENENGNQVSHKTKRKEGEV